LDDYFWILGVEDFIDVKAKLECQWLQLMIPIRLGKGRGA